MQVYLPTQNFLNSSFIKSKSLFLPMILNNLSWADFKSSIIKSSGWFLLTLIRTLFKVFMAACIRLISFWLGKAISIFASKLMAFLLMALIKSLIFLFFAETNAPVYFVFSILRSVLLITVM